VPRGPKIGFRAPSLLLRGGSRWGLGGSPRRAVGTDDSVYCKLGSSELTLMSNWSLGRLAIVSIVWIALVWIVGPRLAPHSKWTMTGPDGKVELQGIAYSPRRNLYISMAAFGPPIVLVALWWMQRR